MIAHLSALFMRSYNLFKRDPNSQTHKIEEKEVSNNGQKILIALVFKIGKIN